MKNEMKQELTRRLCECNNGGLVLVLYDIYFAFSLDVRNALGSGDSAALKKGVADVQAALDELMGALDFNYSVAGQLYPLYSYCKRLFSTALYSLDVAVVDEADVEAHGAVKQHGRHEETFMDCITQSDCFAVNLADRIDIRRGYEAAATDVDDSRGCARPAIEPDPRSRPVRCLEIATCDGHFNLIAVPGFDVKCII